MVRLKTEKIVIDKYTSSPDSMWTKSQHGQVFPILERGHFEVFVNTLLNEIYFMELPNVDKCYKYIFYQFTVPLRYTYVTGNQILAI